MLSPPVTEFKILIQDRWPGLTEARARSFMEAASVCLEHNEKEEQFELHRRLSNRPASSAVYRRLHVDEQLKSAYGDLQEATEEGACGVSMLLARVDFGFVVARRAFKGPGSGVDYWLSQEGPEHRPKLEARLEVSGILCDPNEVQSRLNTKKKQTMASASSGVQALVAVVEFSTPVVVMELF